MRVRLFAILVCSFFGLSAVSASAKLPHTTHKKSALKREVKADAQDESIASIYFLSKEDLRVLSKKDPRLAKKLASQVANHTVDYLQTIPLSPAQNILLSKTMSPIETEMMRPMSVSASLPGEAQTQDDKIDPKMAELRRNYQIEEWNYKIYALQHNRGLYENQQRAGGIIFAMVILLVMAGLTFSALQMYDVLVLTRATAGTSNAAANKDPATQELEISLQGLKVKTSVLGISILAFSLVFFYLYLVNVFRIDEPTAPVNPNTPTPTAQAKK